MEELMVKAIRQFKREHKNAEIRTCVLYQCSGPFRNRVDALFHIKYVEEICGEYKSLEIKVSK